MANQQTSNNILFKYVSGIRDRFRATKIKISYTFMTAYIYTIGTSLPHRNIVPEYKMPSTYIQIKSK